jgi:hypothetical protein
MWKDLTTKKKKPTKKAVSKKNKNTDGGNETA